MHTLLFDPHTYVSLGSAHELKQQLGLGGTFSCPPVPDMILQQLRAKHLPSSNWNN